MRCLVIAPQPFFTPRGTPFSVYYRTLVLSELGADIDLLTFGEGQDPDIPNVRILRVPRFAWLGNVRIGPSMLKLFLDVFIAARTVALLIRHRYDVVQAHEEAVFICRFLKPIFRFKLIYDMHSSLPQQLINFDFTDSRIVHYIFKRLEASSINMADAVITICPDLADYVSHIIDDRDRHHLIENSIFEPVKLKGDEQVNENEQSFSYVAETPAGRFCFVYVGTLEPYQGIDLLIRSFAYVIQRRPEAILLIVGGTESQVETYKSLAMAEGLKDSCLFTGTVSQQQAHQYIRTADSLLSPRINGTNTPLKIYQLLASGIPLVATNVRSHTQVLNDDVAFLADPKPKPFGEAMIAAMSDDGTPQGKAKNAIRLFEKEYSRESYVRKLRALLDGLSECAE
jgi:glycosyltransferase involved in cell wall biosynthesis